MTINAEDFRSSEGRYHRQSLISWWDQERVGDAKVLVIGAGALGNEILKTLALVGVGRVLVVDMDSVEHSNLSRSVLFREGDEGESKAEVARRRLAEINPEIRVTSLTGNALHDLGVGAFLWADVAICGVDNREARIFVNRCSSLAKKTWVDGAIEGLSGIVRAFRPHEGVCYECTMSRIDREQVAKRRSCALLAREVHTQGFAPATASTASIIGALQAQEALKILHGEPALIGEGLHFDGVACRFDRVTYPRRDECPGHDSLTEIESIGAGVSDLSLEDLVSRAESELGAGARLDLSRDVITRLTCEECGEEESVGAALGAVTERRASCPKCGAHRIVTTLASVGRDSPVDLERTPADIGLPPFDVVVMRRGLEESRALCFDGDRERVLGRREAT